MKQRLDSLVTDREGERVAARSAETAIEEEYRKMLHIAQEKDAYARELEAKLEAIRSPLQSGRVSPEFYHQPPSRGGYGYPYPEFPGQPSTPQRPQPNP